MRKTSAEIKSVILDYYYSEVYKKYLFSRSIQSAGVSYFEKSVEKYWAPKSEQVGRILEIGAGSGEHLPFVKTAPSEKYVCLDLRENIDATWKTGLKDDILKTVEFVIGDAQNLPFADAFFDRTLSTCLLHHVDDPIQVMLEARRVTKPGGEIAFALPTDPGILNQFIKRFISGPRLKKYSFISPKTIYALEHPNHVAGLLEFSKLVFEDDDLIIHFDPFKLPSWNLNLLCVIHVVRSNQSSNYDYGGRL